MPGVQILDLHSTTTTLIYHNYTTIQQQYNNNTTTIQQQCFTGFPANHVAKYLLGVPDP